LVILNITLICG